jgi:hypothetical protein
MRVEIRIKNLHDPGAFLLNVLLPLQPADLPCFFLICPIFIAAEKNHHLLQQILLDQPFSICQLVLVFLMVKFYSILSLNPYQKFPLLIFYWRMDNYLTKFKEEKETA